MSNEEWTIIDLFINYADSIHDEDQIVSGDLAYVVDRELIWQDLCAGESIILFTLVIIYQLLRIVHRRVFI
jgi:hypothetical protein